MPWQPSYDESHARDAIALADTWAGALRILGLSPRGKSYATLRKWAGRWDIDTSHLPPHRPRQGPRYTKAEARAAISASKSMTEALRRLGYCPTGGNPGTLKAWAERWGIPTEHFDPWAANRDALRRANRPTPLDEILVEGSSYSRGNLKKRLFEAGVKPRQCELCGQDELWRGRRIGLILDHVNGVRNDNRIENLRIVCPNCAATLDTHCGRKNRLEVEPRHCLRCGRGFRPSYPHHRYCSRACGSRWARSGKAIHATRRVERPGHDRLLHEIETYGYLAVGRKYGVSDNAIRKWIRLYERERALKEGRDPDSIEIPRRTWPNRRAA